MYGMRMIVAVEALGTVSRVRDQCNDETRRKQETEKQCYDQRMCKIVSDSHRAKREDECHHGLLPLRHLQVPHKLPGENCKYPITKTSNSRVGVSCIDGDLGTHTRAGAAGELCPEE